MHVLVQAGLPTTCGRSARPASAWFDANARKHMLHCRRTRSATYKRHPTGHRAAQARHMLQSHHHRNGRQPLDDAVLRGDRVVRVCMLCKWQARNLRHHHAGAAAPARRGAHIRDKTHCARSWRYPCHKLPRQPSAVLAVTHSDLHASYLSQKLHDQSVGFLHASKSASGSRMTDQSGAGAHVALRSEQGAVVRGAGPCCHLQRRVQAGQLYPARHLPCYKQCKGAL